MGTWNVLRAIPSRLWRLAITSYAPDGRDSSYMERSQSQENPRAGVTVAVPSTAESRRLFGVNLARRGIQPVFLRVANRSATSLRLQMVSVDPRYFTPLEAAASSHFSVLRRLSAFGALAWVFLPLLPLVPLKLVTAWRANRRMDEFFRGRGFRIGPIAPGETAEGFVFTTLDLGTKVVHVRLTVLGGIRQTIEDLLARHAPALSTAPAAGAVPDTVDFTFTVPVPGIDADYHGRDFSSLHPASAVEPCTADELVAKLEALPPATTNATASRGGDPVNLVIIGDFAALLGAFAARWDESESITLQTCWKTARAFLLGSDYRYSPVSSLHLFGRDQDIALQRARRSINERLHLRLWLTPLTFADRPVWVGQVSRDIGVRFTMRAWNLTTHRIDPDVDESRDYVIEDLALAGRVEAAGYVGGVGACSREAPHRNLTGDPFFTDGKRAVIVLSPTRRA